MEEELRKLHPPRHPRQTELEPRSRRAMVGDPRVSVIHEGGGPGDSEEESDSDGPILYRDDDDDDDEDTPPSNLAFIIPMHYTPMPAICYTTVFFFLFFFKGSKLHINSDFRLFIFI